MSLPRSMAFNRYCDTEEVLDSSMVMNIQSLFTTLLRNL